MNEQETSPARKSYLVRLYDAFFSTWSAFVVLCSIIAVRFMGHATWDGAALISLGVVLVSCMLAAWRKGR